MFCPEWMGVLARVANKEIEKFSAASCLQQLHCLHKCRCLEITVVKSSTIGIARRAKAYL